MNLEHSHTGLATEQRASAMSFTPVTTDREVDVDLRIESVDFISAEANYVRLHSGGASRRIRATIVSIMDRLDRDRFARIHRSMIVNVERIVELRPGNSGDATVTLRDGTQLRVSRSFRSNLERFARPATRTMASVAVPNE